jgi:hypothetical protein
MNKGGQDGYLMDRQYQYVFVGDSDYHGFLSYCPGECIDQVAEERIRKQHRAKRIEHSVFHLLLSNAFSLSALRYALCRLGARRWDGF